MRLEKVITGYKVAYRHNPRHFYKNSFRIEKAPEGRIFLVGRCHLPNKNFRIVGILKPL